MPLIVDTQFRDSACKPLGPIIAIIVATLEIPISAKNFTNLYLSNLKVNQELIKGLQSDEKVSYKLGSSSYKETFYLQK